MRLTKLLNKHFNPYEKENMNRKEPFVSAVIVVQVTAQGWDLISQSSLLIY